MSSSPQGDTYINNNSNQQGSSAASNQGGSKNILFIGDLAIFCRESDLRDTFSPYGEIQEIKIIKSEEGNRNLSYGFVKFQESIAASGAMDALNGTMLCGRKMRINWAAYKAKSAGGNNTTSSNEAAPESSAVHVSFISYQVSSFVLYYRYHITKIIQSPLQQTKRLVTEASLRELFGRFGDVSDVSIKKSTIDEVNSSPLLPFNNLYNLTSLFFSVEY
jgi:RNA recognition motif-containing protein